MELTNQVQSSGSMSLLNRNTDIFMGIAVISILAVMVIPIPSVMLDLLLSFNITFALVILLLALYILKPLDLSSFPSILLLATLIRLSLNVASTRLILLRGNEGTQAAGKVIMAFGNFVVGGNYVVGFIVFAILVVINFLVITKGAGRIAEVAARFTLDAMPGKQMSIDADLNAGIIDEQEAKARRETIAREAEYYGAMDGANKFVRGDAIAGIVITIINIVGGFAIGVLQNQMTFADAAQNYTLLTIGDGLVTQIPALIISSAAGILVTRAGSKASLGREISSQVLLQPRAIGVAATVLLAFALIPGLPFFPFLILALIAGGIAYTVLRMRRVGAEQEKEVEAQKEKVKPVEMLRPLPPVDALALEVGYGLIHLVDVEQNGELLDRIRSLRRQIAQEIGIIIPSVHIQDNMQLKPGEYTLSLKGNEVARGELMPNYYLAMRPEAVDEKLDGIPTKEPTYGLPATWIKEEAKEGTIAKGFTVVDVPTVLITHLSDVVRRYAHEMLGRQELQDLLDSLKASHPKVVDELIPSLLPLGSVLKVLQNLLREQIPVRDLLSIVEALADWAPMTQDVEILTEYTRQSLSRTITGLYRSPQGNLPLVTVDQNIEKTIAEAIQDSEHGSFLAIEPNVAQKIINNVARNIENFSQLGLQPIILCSARIRAQFKKMVDRFIPNLVVLSYDEILSTVEIQTLGTVGLVDAD